MRPTKVGGIFVRTDDPAFLENQIDPGAEVMDLERINVTELKAEYRKRERCFSTAPIDPEGRLLRFFPGGFSIWSGFPGNGKTALLRQLACHLIHRQQNVFVCSLEEKPRDVFMRHACVALGTENPSTDSLQACADMWCERLKIWNYAAGADCARYTKILAAIRVLAKEHGVRHAIIDSLMCLDVPSNDYEAQRMFTLALTASAELSDCHIHLVAHPKKPMQVNAASDIADVAGASDLGRRADNVLFVKRAENEAQIASAECRPMLVSVRKQRYGSGFIGDISGYFNHVLRQFVREQFHIEPIHYLPSMAYVGRIDQEPLDLPS